MILYSCAQGTQSRNSLHRITIGFKLRVCAQWSQACRCIVAGTQAQSQPWLAVRGRTKLGELPSFRFQAPKEKGDLDHLVNTAHVTTLFQICLQWWQCGTCGVYGL